MLTHPQILFWGAYNFEKNAENRVLECLLFEVLKKLN